MSKEIDNKAIVGRWFVRGAELLTDGPAPP
jgi:hypothetical protein